MTEPVQPSSAASASDIVLGLCGTLDIEVPWDSERMGELARELGIKTDDLDTQLPISDLRSLACVLLGFLSTSSGGERFADNRLAVEEFVRRIPGKITAGGTAVRAAIAMDLLDVPATVSVVEAAPLLREALPASTVLIAHRQAQVLSPHLIFQYPAGAKVELCDGTIQAQHPNRVIVTNDAPNSEMSLAPSLPGAVAGAEFVLLSSVNAVRDQAMLTERLQQLAEIVRQRPPGSTFMWEDAGYHRPEFRGQVASVMSEAADIYSMNEDELAEFIGRVPNLRDSDDVVNSVSQLRDTLGAENLVVHSKYWALAVGRDAQRLRQPLRAGIAMASTRYLSGDEMTLHDYQQRWNAEPGASMHQLATEIESQGAGIVCEPALDLLSESPTTIGLGDAFVGGFIAAYVSVTGQ